MCLIAFAIDVSRQWPLVVASNRDEFLNRPTLPLARWQPDAEQPIFSGRDLQAGGTWLGVTPGGRVAFLTNVRESKSETAFSSRGNLVTRWLAGHEDFSSFESSLQRDKLCYGGFNLVLGDLQKKSWAWLTNRSGPTGTNWHAEMLKSGVYGLSNAGLNTPWPKTVALKKALMAAMKQENKTGQLEILQKSLWQALARPEQMPFASLPMRGISETMQRALSSIFVDCPEMGYGTRSSTLLVASNVSCLSEDPALQIDIREKTHGRSGFNGDALHSEERKFLFHLDV
ncbi:MAG: hypothetical protein JWR74_461 [Polaromonas sp.]|jgi:uncharacterized protein with NRDE domain|nr:hypothetical protein [Polaromonas sp.]